MLGAVRIITSPHLVELVPYPRSPARAKRRARLGFRQHMASRPSKKAISLPDGTLVVHPAMYAQLKQQLEAAQRRVHHEVDRVARALLMPAAHGNGDGGPPTTTITPEMVEKWARLLRRDAVPPRSPPFPFFTGRF